MITPTTIKNFFISTLYIAGRLPFAQLNGRAVHLVPHSADENHHTSGLLSEFRLTVPSLAAVHEPFEVGALITAFSKRIVKSAER